MALPFCIWLFGLLGYDYDKQRPAQIYFLGIGHVVFLKNSRALKHRQGKGSEEFTRYNQTFILKKNTKEIALLIH